jgi:hypothetical protein
MRFRRADWIFLVLAAAVVVFVSMLPSPRDRNPMIPATAAHRGLTTESQCLQCHTPEGTRPLSARHPKRKDCFRCHARSSAQ